MEFCHISFIDDVDYYISLGMLFLNIRIWQRLVIIRYEVTF